VAFALGERARRGTSGTLIARPLLLRGGVAESAGSATGVAMPPELPPPLRHDVCSCNGGGGGSVSGEYRGGGGAVGGGGGGGCGGGGGKS